MNVLRKKPHVIIVVILTSFLANCAIKVESKTPTNTTSLINAGETRERNLTTENELAQLKQEYPEFLRKGIRTTHGTVGAN